MNFIVAHSCGSCVTLPQLFFFPKISTTSLKHKTYLKNSTTIGLQQPGLIHYFWEQHNEMVEFTIKDSPIFGLQLRQLQPGHSVRTILHYSQQKKLREKLLGCCLWNLPPQGAAANTIQQHWHSAVKLFAQAQLSLSTDSQGRILVPRSSRLFPNWSTPSQVSELRQNFCQAKN